MSESRRASSTRRNRGPKEAVTRCGECHERHCRCLHARYTQDFDPDEQCRILDLVDLQKLCDDTNSAHLHDEESLQKVTTMSAKDLAALSQDLEILECSDSAGDINGLKTHDKISELAKSVHQTIMDRAAGLVNAAAEHNKKAANAVRRSSVGVTLHNAALQAQKAYTRSQEQAAKHKAAIAAQAAADAQKAADDARKRAEEAKFAHLLALQKVHDLKESENVSSNMYLTDIPP